MNRRVFLGSLAATAAAENTGDRLRIAFLGGSHSHAFEKVRVVRENPAFELAGVVEDDPVVRESFEKAGVAIIPRGQALEDKTIRVIAVESPVKQHAVHARLALEAGKHIHLEKPPSDNLQEFQALVSLAKKNRLLMQLGYMWRHHTGLNTALEAARKGWLGDVYMVRGTINTLIPGEQRAAWEAFRGGQMFEQGCHLIDPLVRLLGRPAKVTPFLHRDGAFDDNMADNTAAVLEYPRAMGIVMSSTLQPNGNRHRAFEIFGSNGNAVLRPVEPGILQLDLAKAAGPYAAGPQTVKTPPFQRYSGDFAELAECVRSGKPLSVTLEEDLAVHEALLRASGMM